MSSTGEAIENRLSHLHNAPEKSENRLNHESREFQNNHDAGETAGDDWSDDGSWSEDEFGKNRAMSLVRLSVRSLQSFRGMKVS